MKNILLLFILFTGVVSWGQDYDIYLNSFHSEGVGNKNISSFSFDIPDTVNSFKIDFNPYEVPDAIYIKYGEKEIWSGFITEFKDTNYYRVYSELVPGMLVGETVDVTDNSGLKVATLTRVLPGKYTFNGSKGYIIASEDRKDGRMKISNDFEEYFLKALQKEPKEYKVVAISKKTSKNNGSFLVRPEDENFNTPKNYVGELIQEKTNNGYLDFINSEINKIGGNPITSLFNGGDEELEKTTNSIINGSKKYYGIEKTFGNVLEGQTSFILEGNKGNNKLQVIVFSTKKEEKKQFDGIITTCSSCIMKNDKNNGVQKEYYPFRGNSANFKDVKIIQTSIQSEKNEILALQKLIDKKTNLINDLNRIRLGYGVDFFTVKRKYIDGKLTGKKLDEFTDYILLKDDYDEILVQIKKQSLRLAQLKEELLKEASKPYYQPSLKESFTYVNGQKTGIHKEFDKNENLVVEEELKDGLRNGSFKRYENGKVKEEGKYLNNKKIGIWTIHSYNGKEEITYSNDLMNGDYKKFNGDVVVQKGAYQNNLKEGEWYEYYDNGKTVALFKEGKKNGLFVRYFQDTLIEGGTYSNDLMVGDWVYKYSNGKPKGIGKFSNGNGTDVNLMGIPRNNRHGRWSLFYENGQIKQDGQYENGQKQGEFIFWHDNGQIRTLITYVNDKPRNESIRIDYNPDGTEKDKYIYVDGQWEEYLTPEEQEALLIELQKELDALNSELDNLNNSSSDYETYDNSSYSSGSSSPNSCSTCQGSGKCSDCSKPQKVYYWRNGWQSDKETRLGKTVCTQCRGDGKIKEHISNGKMDRYENCFVSSCNNGWIKCRRCYGDGECDRCHGKGTRD